MLRSNRIIKLFFVLSALLLSASAQPQTITGKVVGVNVGLKGKAGANAPAMSLYNDGSLA